MLTEMVVGWRELVDAVDNIITVVKS